MKQENSTILTTLCTTALALGLLAADAAMAGPEFSINLSDKPCPWCPWSTMNIAPDTPAAVGPLPTPVFLLGGEWTRYNNSGSSPTLVYCTCTIGGNQSHSTWCDSATEVGRISGTFYNGANGWSSTVTDLWAEVSHTMIFDDIVFTTTGSGGPRVTTPVNLQVNLSKPLYDVATSPPCDHYNTNSLTVTVDFGTTEGVSVSDNFNGVLSLGAQPISFGTPYTLQVTVLGGLYAHVDACGTPLDDAMYAHAQIDYLVEFLGTQVFTLPEGITANSVQANIVDNTWSVLPTPTIVTATSFLNHGGTDLAIDLTANNIEPRADGVLSLDFEVSAPVSAVSASVACVNNPFGGAATTSALGTTVTVDFSVALPDQDCCTVTLTGDAEDSFDVVTLRGDINRDGVVSTADASIIKPKFGQIPTVVGAEFDYNVDGIVSTADFSQVKPLFGNAGPACP